MTGFSDHAAGRLLADIVFWGERLAGHIDGFDERRFEQDRLACDAVCWCIACIGEAAGNIRRMHPDLVELSADLQLAHAYAMRNRIAHGYASVDLGILWNTATDSVPSLVEAARQRLASGRLGPSPA